MVAWHVGRLWTRRNASPSRVRPLQTPGASTFVVLPGGGFASVSNSTDSIYFMGPDGSFITAGPIAAPSPDLRSTSGVVVGDRLIMVDSGPDLVPAYDLDTHEGPSRRTSRMVHRRDAGLCWAGKSSLVWEGPNDGGCACASDVYSLPLGAGANLLRTLEPICARA
jgi:hypothetical protein